MTFMKDTRNVMLCVEQALDGTCEHVLIDFGFNEEDPTGQRISQNRTCPDSRGTPPD